VAPHPLLGKSASLAEAEVQSLLCVPLRSSDKVAGVIYVGSRAGAQAFDQDHLQLLAGIAGIASLAFDNVRHVERLKEENRLLHAEVAGNQDMVGQNPRMKAVYELIRRVAGTESTVLIQGESGTGKELVARAIHASSRRAEGPFVAINCAAITETLLESELFGHEKGAFTGAVAQKRGKLEIANGGTLFLDEIGELAPSLQAKLLRVLQEREFEHVGGTRALKADVRVVAATNRNLAQAVEAGTFRGDLYYRLKVVAVTVPPLRERKEDIPVLAEHFVALAARKCTVRPKPLSAAARACLINYDWPGNVRELENAIERAVVLGSAESILPEDLPEEIFEAEAAGAAPSPAQYQNLVKDRKKQVILNAMEQAKGNYLEAAKILGLHPNSLLRLIRNFGLKESSR
jgi:Nif-specific regulatory protein